jgi:hypothetical protein
MSVLRIPLIGRALVDPRRLVALAAALWTLCAPVQAQEASEGKGLLTIEVGQGSAPVGGIASQVASTQLNVPHDLLHGTAFRLTSGYHFAEQLSVEVGVGHLGTMHSRAPYGSTDTLTAEASVLLIEGDIVGNFPLSPSSRLDVTLGITETALHTTLSTQRGSALPTGQRGDDNVRRLGATAGIDLEWRLGAVTSLLVGYHIYPRVGSPVLRDSASGTAKALLCGLRFEF